MSQNIVAIGGLGLSDPLLREFILRLTAKGRPRVLYIPTANGDNPAGIVSFYESFIGCDAYHLPLFTRRDEDLEELIRRQDVIYVGGGNTENMLAIWRLHGVDSLLRRAWEDGTVMCGSSAGSICWFECSITDSFGPRLAELHDGLGFLPGSNCPHYDSEVLRRPVYTAAVQAGFPAGYAAEDAVALHFQGKDLHEAVSARPAARAYRVDRVDQRMVETALPVRYLG